MTPSARAAHISGVSERSDGYFIAVGDGSNRSTSTGDTSAAERSRSDSDWLDYHDPTAGIGGAAPARSALRLRLLLALFGLGVCVASMVIFIVRGIPVGAVLIGLCGIGALANVVVVMRRLHLERSTER